MRLIVCGGRDYTDRHAIARLLADIAGPREGVTLVHGDCAGADRVAAAIAGSWGWAVEPHPPNIERYGSPAAFHIRNQEIVDAGGDAVAAFPGGAGTANCVARAEKAGIPVHRWSPDG